MIKRNIKETNEKYDKDGNLIEKTVREETEEECTNNAYAGTGTYANTGLYTFSVLNIKKKEGK